MPKPHVKISVDQIPDLPGPMPVLKLGAAVAVSDEILGEALRAVAADAKLEPIGDSGVRAAYDGDRLVGYVHPKTGESRVFPALEALEPSQELAALATRRAAALVSDGELFRKDLTDVVALAPQILTGSTRRRDSDRIEHRDVLGVVRFQRQVNGVTVFGPGTRAVVSVGAHGTIYGLAHRWRDASEIDGHMESRRREEVVAEIIAQLTPLLAGHDIKIEDVSVAYYDGGGSFLQPVYRFHAVVDIPEEKDPKQRLASRRMFGFVSIGAAREPLPIVGSKPDVGPGDPPASPVAKAPPPGDPTIGRYVVRNDNSGWVASANAFMSNLKLAENWTHMIPFSDTQYFWAYPRLFTTDKNTFVNSVHIALTEVHGNWNLFTTLQNNQDFVYLNQIKNPGYGGQGHSLAYWIIHSCEVIPTATDETTSFDVWWQIFQGLHAVMGYRTEMWINDEVTGGYALSIGLGAPMVGAWLSHVSSDDSYDDSYQYLDTNRGILEPMGRASAIAVSGHGDDHANNLGSLGPASSLTEWWFNN
jgi:hypothetical protein